MGEDERAGAESFAALWQDLDRERQARDWTRERLARRTVQLSQQPLSEKTLHDRMTHGRRVPWDQVVWIVRALELDEQSWKQRWEHANNARHRDRPSSPLIAESNPTPNHLGPTTGTHLTPTVPSSAEPMPAPLPLWRSRIASAASGFVAGAAVTLIIVWVTGANWLTNDRPPPDTCALVSPPTADVFLSVTDDPKPMFIKYRGDRITLPLDRPTKVTADGNRYRMVHTMRAPSGYAYMREDALTSVPC